MTVNKQNALDRASYLLATLEDVHIQLLEQSKTHAETCILTGKATSMCLPHFSNLQRILVETINAIEKI